MFGVGVANISTKDNRNLFDTNVSASNRNQLTSENNIGALWNTGFRFYINESWSLRLDITGVSYKAEKTKSDEQLNKSTASKIFTNYDLGLGLNYAF
jgi:outer membrane protein W